ncbi:nitrite/sulfite reductase [Clostridium sp. YIM B02551]|uniref:nitrite/sulfite reductase n=1 Tax=Clostridium sp. YIM B02551 TaxID=2910679 RepID=UPI001EEB2B2C|nr:nitrite/sulfite reductase [Clostridium sp. YIM B02551]
MEELKKVLLEEIVEFNKVGHKYLNGEITKSAFKKASGGMGVYAHRKGDEFMIRLRTLSGVISKDKLKLIYSFSEKYKLPSIHLTTRQAIQLHGLNIDEICEVMKDALENDIYTRGAGGNFPRNVAISPLSGVEKGESFDVTPYALAVNEYFLRKINTYKLPRKLKVSFSNNNDDLSHATVVDQGFIAVNQDGNEFFNVYIGGGLGRNPKLSVLAEELVEPKDVLYHVEAITRLFIAEGDYNNPAKARIRYILDRMGEEEFIKCYKHHLAAVKKEESLDLTVKAIEVNKDGQESNIEHPRLFPQKQKGLYSVYFHPIGGQLKRETLKDLIDEIENIDEVQVRLSMTEGVFIRNLNSTEAERILKLTQGIGGENRIEQSVACIGVPTCQIGALNGQGTLKEIIDTFRTEGITKDILPRVHISGCHNSCGVHEIGEIGFSGKLKKVDNESLNVFEVHIGGALGVEKTKLGKYYGDIPQKEVSSFLLDIAKKIESGNLDFYKWLDNKEEELNVIFEKYSV